ncbi:PROTEIN putative-RELATED [Salix purpurea]|uniref:PROTEIN putative-RELATED n=1 Tax=Salix purpurea TaxID=77065 RepID=A0A9Q0SX90_SALPP|nr:PROTEIN putative-RELATED [Salix purpurea]
MCRILYMKSFLFFLLLLSFLSFAELNHARKEASEYYWKSMTKDQPIPEAIRDLLVRDPAGSDKMNHFVKDFDTKHSAIIYHNYDLPSSKAPEPGVRRYASEKGLGVDIREMPRVDSNIKYDVHTPFPISGDGDYLMILRVRGLSNRTIPVWYQRWRLPNSESVE